MNYRVQATEFYRALQEANQDVPLPPVDKVSNLEVEFSSGAVSTVRFTVVGLEIPLPAQKEG